MPARKPALTPHVDYFGTSDEIAGTPPRDDQLITATEFWDVVKSVADNADLHDSLQQIVDELPRIDDVSTDSLINTWSITQINQALTTALSSLNTTSIAGLDSEIASLNTSLTDAQNSVTGLNTSLATANVRIDDVVTDVNENQNDIAALQALLSADDVDFDTAQERLNELKRLAGLIGALTIANIDQLQPALQAKASASDLYAPVWPNVSTSGRTTGSDGVVYKLNTGGDPNIDPAAALSVSWDNGIHEYHATIERSNADGITIIDATGTGTGVGCFVIKGDKVHTEPYLATFSPDRTTDQVAFHEALKAGYILGRETVAETLNCNDEIRAADHATVITWSAYNVLKFSPFRIGRINVNHNGYGIRSTGAITPIPAEIYKMFGPGVSLPYAAKDSGIERVALRLFRGGHYFKIHHMQGFNIGTLSQGAYTADIEVISHVAVARCFVSRLEPADPNVPGDVDKYNQEITYTSLRMGGVFTNSNFENDAERRASGSDNGLYLDDISGATFNIGTLQYVNMTSTSIAVWMGENCRNNTVNAYFEGVSDQGELLHILGRDNTINNRGPMGSPNLTSEIPRVKVFGYGNRINGLRHMMDASARAALTTSTGAPPWQIGRGNHVVGSTRYRTLDKTQYDTGNLIPENTPITPQFSSSVVTRAIVTGQQPPEITRPIRVHRFTITSNAEARQLSAYVAAPAGVGYVKVGIMAKNELTDRALQVALFLETDAGAPKEGHTLTPIIGGGWQYTDTIFIVPPTATQMRIRTAIRSGGANVTDNCQGLVTNPFMSMHDDYVYLDDERAAIIKSLNIGADFADDAAAATGGIQLGQPYLSSGVLRVRVV